MSKIKTKGTLNTLKNDNEQYTTIWKITTELLFAKLPPDDLENEDNEQSILTRETSKIYNPEQEKENNEELIVTNWDVERAIKRLSNGKVPGPDDIKNEIYKENKDIWTPYLVRLFRECLEQGIFPNSW